MSSTELHATQDIDVEQTDFTAEEEIISNTDHGLGWEAGAGVIFPLDARLPLTPGAV